MLVSGKFPYVMKTGRPLREVEIKARARIHPKIKPQTPPYLINMDGDALELADVRNSRHKPALAGTLIMTALCLLVDGLAIMAAVEINDSRALALLLIPGPLTVLAAVDAYKAFQGRRCRAHFNRETGQTVFYDTGGEILRRPWPELFFCIGGRGLGPGPVSEWELFSLQVAASGAVHSGGSDYGYIDLPGFDWPHYGRTQMDRYPVYLFCHLLDPAGQVIEATWAFGCGDFKDIQSHWNFISDFMDGSSIMKKPR